ncbi:MAG: ABC transporter substrate-binding protein [Puniceicoccales bacterium]
MKGKFKLSYVSILILVVAYVFSAGRFLMISFAGEGDGENNGKRRVLIAHWQLEPGFRDGFQWAIDEYNKLPHVKAAGVEVEQTGITEKVYAQFMNVHLISGTAPDIAAKGQTQLIQGNAIAKFFAPLGSYVLEPNPYNNIHNLDEDLPPELADYLAKAPWKDTFVDGMQAGYDEQLDDYYAVPISSYGAIRIFYNMRLVAEAKNMVKRGLASDPEPEWLQNCWIRESDGEVQGYLPNNQRLWDWLEGDEPPETLGQLMLFSEAIQAYAKETGKSALVPVSGSRYSASDLTFYYQKVFFSHYVDRLNLNPADVNLSQLESIVGWFEGNRWNWDDPAIKQSMDFGKIFTRYYPTGYVGLDREQAQRRFVLGNAASIASGGWDAAGILYGAANRDDPEERFEVLIRPIPFPAEGERWEEFLPIQFTAADANAGVPLAINKASKNFEWALDFLKFATSEPINERMNMKAGWLPSAVGAKTIEVMEPFVPIVEGRPADWVMSTNVSGGFDAIQSGQRKLYLSGDITYEEFVKRMEAYLNIPQVGMKRIWYRAHQSYSDSMRASDRNLSVEDFEAYFNDDERAKERAASILYQSLTNDEGIGVLLLHHIYNPGEEFPTF